MELKNYWWLVIWLFVGGGFFAFYIPRQPEKLCGRTVWRWHWLAALGLAFPYWLWAAGRRYFGDSWAYLTSFHKAPGSLQELGSYVMTSDKDKGFSALVVLIKALVGDSDILYFGVIAGIQILCLVYVYRKYSSSYWVSMFLFVASTDYLSWMQNGMRQFLACALIFAGFTWMVQKKYLPLILLILLASTIHGSALIMLPIVFLVQGKAMSKRTVFTVAAMLLIVLSIDKFTPLLGELLADTQYSDMMGNEIWASDDGTNVIRVLVYSVPALLAIAGRHYIWQEDDPVINLSVNCSLITMGLYAIAAVSSGIYIGRLPIYTTLMGYISLPWILDHMFTKGSAQFMKVMMVLGFLAFFYFQMHFTWALL